jgi:predicted permease
MYSDRPEEMQQHLAEKKDALTAADLSPEAAGHRAHYESGNKMLEARSREAWQFPVLEGVWADILFALRQIRKSPGFAMTTILTLAIGIGANTAAFGLLYAVLLRSLPVSNPQQLVRLELSNKAMGVADPVFSYPVLQELRKAQHSLIDLSGWGSNLVFIRDKEGSLRSENAEFVTGNAFGLLGVQPFKGRMLTPADDVPGGTEGGWNVVLNYGYWKDHFQGDPDILGKQMTITNQQVTIVGVAAPNFESVVIGDRPKVYLPLHFMSVTQQNARQDLLHDPMAFFLFPIGRLKPGVTLQQANANIATLKDPIFHSLVPPNAQMALFLKQSTLQVVSARHGWSFLSLEYFKPLMLVQGIAGIVLLLCCVNISGLMLVRIFARRHEFAVRTALGSSRLRIVRQALTEAFLLAFAGGVVAVTLAWFSTGFLSGFLTSPGAVEKIVLRPDPSMLLMTGLLAVVTTLLFGSIPALLAARSDPGSLLKSRTAASRYKNLAGRIFVPIQIALSLLLVISAGLFAESLIHLRSEHTGFNAQHVMITCAQFQRIKKTPEEIVGIYQQMAERLNQMPGIESAALTWVTPITGESIQGDFRAVGDTPNLPEDNKTTYNDVGPGYFKTLQTTLLAGREFTDDDRDNDVCILNRSAANYYFPHQQAIGQYIHAALKRPATSSMDCRVVGIAEDAKYASLREAPPRTVYFPITTKTLGSGGFDNNLVFLMRARTDADATSDYRKVLAEFAPETPLLTFLPLQEQVDESIGTDRMLSILTVVFASLALMLSGIGIFGLMATSVEQRTLEIGVRMAVGASRGKVVSMVLSEALRMVGIGAVMGGIGTIFAVRLLRAYLYDTSSLDPRVIGASLLVLGLVALCAAYVPALRAASVDPIQALRSE